MVEKTQKKSIDKKPTNLIGIKEENRKDLMICSTF